MTKRIRIQKLNTRKKRKYSIVRTSKRIKKLQTKKRRQRGGMFKSIVDSVLNRFTYSSYIVYANIDFVRKLRPMLSQKSMNRKSGSPMPRRSWNQASAWRYWERENST